MKSTRVFGVSPAYFISIHGFSFTGRDIAARLPEIARLGFVGFQAEVPAVGLAREWIDTGAVAAGHGAVTSGLGVHQLAAHYLLDGQSGGGWTGTIDFGMLEAIAGTMEVLPGCDILSIPIAGNTGFTLSALQAFAESALGTLPNPARLALEPLPRSILCAPSMARTFFQRVDARIGLTLDTGNVAASGIAPHALVDAIGGERIFGVHLCDTDGGSRTSLRPGTGIVEWSRLLEGLDDAGYHGPLDIEVLAPENTVAKDYTEALNALSIFTPRRRSCSNMH